ncbi:MAG: ATP-dependent sacrificial sulfur transferase LarE [Bacteroidales bacterium]|nr:MAG: ATP-dependent sacrificial sulfur transferase LarE [Bacteroidales bacterium]
MKKMEELKNNDKYNNLIEYLKKLESVAVAFSGGVDSTFLLASAKEALSDNVVAFTVRSPYIPDWEIKEAKNIANKLNARHIIIDTELSDTILHNPENRCYLCKKLIFTKLKIEAGKLSVKYVIEGTNSDDTKDFRPGIKALKELNIVSPLLENKITKEDIRYFSRLLNLKTWDKPAYACLLTRIPYNTRISEEELRRIEMAEVFLMSLGFKGVRVRSHNNLARIELDKTRIIEVFQNKLEDKIVNKLKDIGYTYVTIDIEGYRTGSMNSKKV